jgi:phage shock protein A
MSETIYLISICLPILAVVVIFAMRYRAQVLQAQARLANDDAYRALADKVAASQAATATALSSMDAALAELRAGVAGVEKILKQVD